MSSYEVIEIVSDDESDVGQNVSEDDSKVTTIKEELTDDNCSVTSVNDTNTAVEKWEPRNVQLDVTKPDQSVETLPIGIQHTGEDNLQETYDNGEAILNLILTNPEEMDLRKKPSGIRHSTAFTLNRQTVPIASAKSDDNGAYVFCGTAQKHFRFDKAKNEAAVAHYDSTVERYYINIRESRAYQQNFIDNDDIYVLSRIYKQSKHNPGFSHTH